MTAWEILKKARDKISNPENWTQGEMARDLNGQAVIPEDETARCWCAVGALEAVCGDRLLAASVRSDISARIDNKHGCHIASYNDTHTRTKKCWHCLTQLLHNPGNVNDH